MTVGKICELMGISKPTLYSYVHESQEIVTKTIGMVSLDLKKTRVNKISTGQISTGQISP